MHSEQVLSSSGHAYLGHWLGIPGFLPSEHHCVLEKKDISGKKEVQGKV
jgi:hypothetical protein